MEGRLLPDTSEGSLSKDKAPFPRAMRVSLSLTEASSPGCEASVNLVLELLYGNISSIVVLYDDKRSEVEVCEATLTAPNS